MAITIVGTAVDGKTKYTFKGSNLAKAKSEWSKFRNNLKKRKIIIPHALDVIYSGDLVLIYPEWCYMNSATNPQPGAGGFENFGAGTDRSYPIHVTSDEYKYSVMNDCTVAVLSKVENYVPVIKNTNCFNLAKVSVVRENRDDKTLYDYMYTQKTRDNETLPEINIDRCLLCDIYDNSGYTIARICNALANVNRRFSFTIVSATKFLFYFAVNRDSQYIPLLYTDNPTNVNMFTPQYFSHDINYYSQSMKWWYNTWSQTIDFTKPYNDQVILNNRTYFADGSKRINNVILTPMSEPK